MNGPSNGEHAPGDSAGKGAQGPNRPARYYKRDFWGKENLKFSQPHFRMERLARIVNRMSHGQQYDVLDVGCGPAALKHLLDSNLRYHGIDIAIQEPARHPPRVGHR